MPLRSEWVGKPWRRPHFTICSLSLAEDYSCLAKVPFVGDNGGRGVGQQLLWWFLPHQLLFSWN